MDHEKLQATLADEHLNAACDLQRACEMVTLLEAQLKEMNPNLDSIAEYGFFKFCYPDFLHCCSCNKSVSYHYQISKKGIIVQ